MTIASDALQRLPPVEYDALRPQLRTGDLALCSGDEAFSKAIRWATKSPWSHVALIVRLPAVDRMMALESVEKVGVRAVPLSRFITEDSARHRPFPGRILFARHTEFDAKGDDAARARMLDFAFDRLGAPFSGGEMAKIALRVAFGGLGVRAPAPLHPADEYICSEYVGKCFEQVGIHIPWDGRGFIAPADFAKAPPVEAIAQVRTR